MAQLDLTTYTGIQDAVAKFLNRDDLSDRIPAFIALTEAEIGRRLRRKTLTKSISIAAQSTALPSDCVELRSVRLVSSSTWQDKPLRVVTPEVLAEIRSSYAAGGRPIAAAMIGGSIVVAPDPNATYTAELRYFERLVPLSGANATNSVLAESPDLYLYGALKHSAPYLDHDERIATWKGFFEDALAQLEMQREREETNASIRPVRIPRRFG